MKKMQIFEPAMCCPTGLCGVGIDPDLLRISTVLETLKKHDIKVDRFNLNSAPMEFVKNKIVNDYINNSGTDHLPITILDEKIIITGRYPTNDEFEKLLELPNSLLGKPKTKVQPVKKTSNNRNCKGGCC